MDLTRAVAPGTLAGVEPTNGECRQRGYQEKKHGPIEQILPPSDAQSRS